MPENKTSMETLKNANWNDVIQEVTTKLRYMQACAEKLPPGIEANRIANDLFLPNLALIAEFCDNIIVE
jgi:hypothetical protein